MYPNFIIIVLGKFKKPFQQPFFHFVKVRNYIFFPYTQFLCNSMRGEAFGLICRKMTYDD